MVEKLATREGFGRVLAKLAEEDRRIVALDCDLGRSTRSFDISTVDPMRFIDMGISEQDMISTAAGMARMGKIPFVNSFAVFVTGRAFDQIRQQLALPCLNVKVCGSSAGITQGPDGATHQSVVDVSLMRSLPNMVVVVPADAWQTEKAVRVLCQMQGPAYLRLSRYATERIVDEGHEFVLGKAQQLDEGEDVAVCACGPLLEHARGAADMLREGGFSPGLYNFHTIKPIDAQMIRYLASRYRYIVSVEEHSVYGGLGTAIAEVIAESPSRCEAPRMKRLGIADCFGESGLADELLKKHGLDSAGILAATKGFMSEG